MLNLQSKDPSLSTMRTRKTEHPFWSYSLIHYPSFPNPRRDGKHLPRIPQTTLMMNSKTTKTTLLSTEHPTHAARGISTLPSRLFLTGRKGLHHKAAARFSHGSWRFRQKDANTLELLSAGADWDYLSKAHHDVILAEHN
jgi:hypothetical protein